MRPAPVKVLRCPAPAAVDTPAVSNPPPSLQLGASAEEMSGSGTQVTTVLPQRAASPTCSDLSLGTMGLGGEAPIEEALSAHATELARCLSGALGQDQEGPVPEARTGDNGQPAPELLTGAGNDADVGRSAPESLEGVAADAADTAGFRAPALESSRGAGSGAKKMEMEPRAPDSTGGSGDAAAIGAGTSDRASADASASVATVVTEGSVPISSVATSDAAPAKAIVIPISPSRAASPAALVVDQSPPLITEIGESSRPATSTTKEEVMEAPPLWLVPVVSVQAFVRLDLDGDPELAARRLL